MKTHQQFHLIYHCHGLEFYRLINFTNPYDETCRYTFWWHQRLINTCFHVHIMQLRIPLIGMLCRISLVQSGLHVSSQVWPLYRWPELNNYVRSRLGLPTPIIPVLKRHNLTSVITSLKVICCDSRLGWSEISGIKTEHFKGSQSTLLVIVFCVGN